MALAYIYAGQGIAVTSQIRQQRVCGEIQRRYLLPRNRQLLQRTEHFQTMDRRNARVNIVVNIDLLDILHFRDGNEQVPIAVERICQIFFESIVADHCRIHDRSPLRLSAVCPGIFWRTFSCLEEVLHLLNLLSSILEFHIAQIFTAVKFTAFAKIFICNYYCPLKLFDSTKN